MMTAAMASRLGIGCIMPLHSRRTTMVARSSHWEKWLCSKVGETVLLLQNGPFSSTIARLSMAAKLTHAR